MILWFSFEYFWFYFSNFEDNFDFISIQIINWFISQSFFWYDFEARYSRFEFGLVLKNMFNLKIKINECRGVNDL